MIRIKMQVAVLSLNFHRSEIVLPSVCAHMHVFTHTLKGAWSLISKVETVHGRQERQTA